MVFVDHHKIGHSGLKIIEKGRPLPEKTSAL
jgi:hypothetical protein